MLIAPSNGTSLKRRSRFDGTRHAKDAEHTGQYLSGDLSTKCRPWGSLDAKDRGEATPRRARKTAAPSRQVPKRGQNPNRAGAMSKPPIWLPNSRQKIGESFVCVQGPFGPRYTGGQALTRKDPQATLRTSPAQTAGAAGRRTCRDHAGNCRSSAGIWPAFPPV